MKRLTIILAGVLAAQLAVALALSFGGSDLSAFKAKEPLLTFDAGRIDQIAIDESGGGSVTLTKRDGKWITPSQADFPADGGKIDDLLKKLAELKAGWPVATTAEAAQRFKVTDKEHERRIILSAGGKEAANLLIGTSPSYRQIHVRVEGSNVVHNIAFATHEVNSRPEEWMNHELLEIAQDKIASISFPDVTVERKDGKFTVPGVEAPDKPNEAEIRAIVGAVSHPSFDAVQGKGAEALAKLDAPDVQFTVKPAEGAGITYKYKKEGDGASYLFSASSQEYVFRVKAASIDPILKARREKLIEWKATPLNIAQDKIASIAFPDVTIERKDGKLAVGALGDNEKLNEAEAKTVVDAVSQPAFDTVQGKGAEAVAKLGAPDLQFTVKQGDGADVTFKYKKEGDGSSYLFNASGQDYVFRVKAASIDPILKAKREKLVEQKKTEGAQADQKPTGDQPTGAPGSVN